MKTNTHQTLLASISLATTLALVTPCAAQAAASRDAAARAPAVAAEVTQAQIDKLRNEGFTSIFSLDYPAAGRTFEEVIRIAPDRPEGYLFRALNTWFKALYDKRLLSTSLYTRDTFYEQDEQAIDPAIDKAFRADVKKAIALGEARVAADPKDVNALYILGATHGTLAGYEASMARAFMSALRNGSKSVDLHEKVVKLDPSFVDAYLTIGMYHYTIGSLPFAVKMLVAVGGVKGSKKNGLAELERVVTEGKRNADDARVVLIGLYTREGQPEKALEMLRQLREKYPANFVLTLEEANLLAEMGRSTDSFAMFDKLVANPRAMASATDFVEYSYGEALMAGREHERALAHYLKVTEWKGANGDVLTLAHLGAGRALDALGRRKQAEERYKIVLRRGNVLDSRKQAEAYLKSPYTPSRPMASTGQASSASTQRSTAS